MLMLIAWLKMQHWTLTEAERQEQTVLNWTVMDEFAPMHLSVSSRAVSCLTISALLWWCLGVEQRQTDRSRPDNKPPAAAAATTTTQQLQHLQQQQLQLPKRRQQSSPRHPATTTTSTASAAAAADADDEDGRMNLQQQQLLTKYLLLGD